ncbi:hypothetical protein EI555_019981 [Monodon monoceros]|uniref:G-protein coupled receptors family 1 profile domain-containing protein n=1 Tax=Monodon monoceros TaxID=40151 RepID=A0A4U1FN04_MONMO|nr:hypothetical protein EI555_019981 [Monodon monoceros]
MHPPNTDLKGTKDPPSWSRQAPKARDRARVMVPGFLRPDEPTCDAAVFLLHWKRIEIQRNMYFVFMFVDMNNFFLAVMAYDSFVAVCHPLHYSANMTHQLCALMVTGSWVIANLNVLLHTLLMAQLSFCADNAIPPFFCDVTPLLKLSCSDTHLNEVMILTEGALIMSTPFVCILVSYIHITCAVLRVQSTKGRRKTFSTCCSHLAVVSFFYGTIIAVYFNPLSSHPSEKDTTATVMYTVVTPMLNPFVYA